MLVCVWLPRSDSNRHLRRYPLAFRYYPGYHTIIPLGDSVHLLSRIPDFGRGIGALTGLLISIVGANLVLPYTAFLFRKTQLFPLLNSRCAQNFQ